MAHTKTNPSPTGKKELRKQIATVLETSLPVLKEGLSDKKLQRNIRKASKVLTEGFLTKAKKATPAAEEKPVAEAKPKPASKPKPAAAKTARKKPA